MSRKRGKKMDIEVKEFKPPKIVINYETLKAELEKHLKVYSGLIVTAETLDGSKAAQKELASLRVKIDTYRKDKKKEIEKPIKEFEAQCKELVALVESVEKPIKEGIKVFDDQKREEKRQKALQLAEEVVEAAGLNEKYAAKLDVIDKYMNLTATAKAVKEDLETRAFALKIEQDREAERLEIINSVIDSENQKLKTKLTTDMFSRMIDSEASTSSIIEEIKLRAAVLYEAENNPVEQPKEEQTTETPQQPEKAVNEAQVQTEKHYTATLKLVGTLEELRSVSAYIKEHGISYEVLDQRAL